MRVSPLTSVQRRLATTVFVLSGITLLSRLLGFVREQILASTLGATYAADAFVAAQLVPTALDTIVGTAMARPSCRSSPRRETVEPTNSGGSTAPRL